MRTVRWFLLLLIPAVMLASPPSRAGGDHTGWVNDVVGYSPEDVRRFVRYRHIRRERLVRQEGYGYGQAPCVRDFWRSCGNVSSHRHAYRWRYYRHGHHRWNGHRRHGHRHHERGDGDRHGDRHGWGGRERIDHGLFCHARRRVIGEERPTRVKAQRAADNAWMGSVRYDHGERYQDINHAKDVRHNCDPSSTTTILNRVFFRCVLEATPCRAPPGSTGERVERRYEEETDDDDK
jgi:hypothetical protein